MKLETLIAECTAYDFKLMLEEKKPKSWLKSVSAFARNQYICELVDKVIMVGVDEGSSLVPLKENFSNKLHSISYSDSPL